MNVNESQEFAYSTEQMFDLVADIEAYPEFVPACTQGEILQQEDDTVQASLSFGKAGFEYSFSTKNTLQRPTAIDMQLLSGPFKSFNATWSFTATAQGSSVSVHAEFEFDTMMLKMMLGPAFEKVLQQILASFKQRAEQLYG
jgi:ribosome-associated toxin RatA of RatAB toxin-antitoxin module